MPHFYTSNLPNHGRQQVRGCRSSGFRLQGLPGEEGARARHAPPPTNGAGDGTGNEDLSKCSAADYDAVSAKLEVAGEECIIVGMRRSERAGVRGRQARAVDGGDGTQTAAESDASVEQLECLAYFLSRTPNPTTVAQACPCLWFHATEVQPWNDSWMKVKC